MDIEGVNFYFLHVESKSDKYKLKTLSNKTVSFCEDKWHKKHQVFYSWHSRGGQYVVSDFEYLNRLQQEFEKEIDFWFVNLTSVGWFERIKAKKIAIQYNINFDSIILDKIGIVGATLRLEKMSTIVFVSRDNFVYKKLEGNFDESKVRQTISSLLKKRLHYDNY